MGGEGWIERSLFFSCFYSYSTPELEVTSFLVIIFVAVRARAQDLPCALSVHVKKMAFLKDLCRLTTDITVEHFRIMSRSKRQMVARLLRIR